MAIDEDNVEDYEVSNAAKVFLIFIIIVFIIGSFSLFTLYSTMRSRSIGIASGYLKATEIAYKTNSYNFQSDLPNHEFESGLYKVNVTSLKSRRSDNAIIVKIEVKEKFFSAILYSEELRLIPISESE